MGFKNTKAPHPTHKTASESDSLGILSIADDVDNKEAKNDKIAHPRWSLSYA